MRKVFALWVVLAFAVGLAQAGHLTPDLKARVDQADPGQMLKVIVRMDREANISIFPSNQQDAMVRHLQAFAGESQRDLLAALPGYGGKVAKVKPFWICNGIAMEATRDVVRDLATRSDVGYIDEDHVIKLDGTHSKEVPGINSVEWNINQISAPQAWAAGYNGAGIVVGNMDTGVDVTHATFGGRWRGGSNSWFDGVAGQPNPYDDHGHGTHTMGTICGGSGADTIGVARGATFVCAKAFDAGGSGQDSWILACYQWFAGTSRPNVFGNSWGNNTGSLTTFWQASRNCQILGIHQAYSNGNAGPGSGTVGCPASYPHLIGVGATDATDAIASFSSRGPSPSFAGGLESTANYLDPAWAASRRKPDLSAPGVNVRSSAPGGGWATMSGTSMASPHVTGVIGLMLQKNPNITEQQIWQILITSVDTPAPGRPYPNQNYGWGRLNAYRAVQMTPGSNQPNIYVNSNTVHDPTGNNNGRWDPGETIGLIVALTNNGAVNATNVNARLRFNDSYITMTDSTNAYGNINSGQTVQGDSFIVRADPGTPQGHGVNFTLHVTYTESLSGVDRQFSVTVGVPPIPPGAIKWGPIPAPVPTSRLIYGVAFNGSDRIYVSDGYSRNYYALSADSNLTLLGTITAPDSLVTDFAWSPSDNMMWAHAGGYNGQKIYKINPTNGTVLRTFNSPATEYATGLTWDGSLLYPVDRRAPYSANPEYIYTCDTLGGNAVQHTEPRYTSMTARCLAIDRGGSGGGTLVHVLTFFTTGGVLDSAALYELDRSAFTLTGNSFLFTSGWNTRGVEYDPRDHNYWITIPQGATSVNSIVKVRGFYQISGVGEGSPVMPGIPSNFALGPARPNPMRQGTTIAFGLPVESKVSLKVYNLAGQLVATLVEGKLPAGRHETRWEGRGQPSGVYFYRLDAGSYSATKKLVLVR